MNSVTIVCARPGMRRQGIAHPARDTYPAGRWSEEQLAAFRADPAFTVILEEAGDEAPASYSWLAAAAASRPSFDFAASADGRFFAAVWQACADAIQSGTSADAFLGEFARLAEEHGLPSLPIDPLDGPVVAAVPAAPFLPVALPGDVAPGADLSDALQDQGTGAPVPDLGAKPAGTAEAAPAVAGDGTVRPPVFDDARVQAIRTAVAALDPDADPASARSLKKLKTVLGFEPTPEEIVAARVVEAAPEAIATT